MLVIVPVCWGILHHAHIPLRQSEAARHYAAAPVRVSRVAQPLTASSVSGVTVLS